MSKAEDAAVYRADRARGYERDPTQTPIARVKAHYGGRLKLHDRLGWMLDGCPITVQRLMVEAGVV